MTDALNASGVDFVIVGAHALAAHGLPRATGDIDLLVRASPENAARVVEALTVLGAPLAAHGLSATDFQAPGTVYQIGLPPRRIRPPHRDHGGDLRRSMVDEDGHHRRWQEGLGAGPRRIATK